MYLDVQELNIVHGVHHHPRQLVKQVFIARVQLSYSLALHIAVHQKEIAQKRQQNKNKTKLKKCTKHTHTRTHRQRLRFFVISVRQWYFSIIKIF